MRTRCIRLRRSVADHEKDLMMLCPVCKNVALVMTERQGIEIDYCPTCRGVWLDRGELDKIIERTIQVDGPGIVANGRGPNDPVQRERPLYDAGRYHDGHHREHGHEHGRQGHRQSFWKDLFD
jgi:Zn-finger nucleic acid-binding protein